MTSRERVLMALSRRKPDRTPRLLYGEVIGYVPAIERLLRERCAPKSPREYFQMDLTGVKPNPTKLPRSRFAEWLPDKMRKPVAELKDILKTEVVSADLPVDEWGVYWRPGGFHHFFHVESPLAGIHDLSRIQEFPWPDLDEPYRYHGLAERISALHAEGLAVAAYAGAIFEQAWYLRGMEALMEDMILRPEIADYLFDRTAYFQRAAAVALTKAGIDLLILGDDVATQRGPMMSLSMWRRFLKPRLAATISAAREIRADLHVFYHCDGDATAFIPELIECGVDVLNPVQPECMDPAAVKRKFGDRLSFFGTVSVQHTMPFGTPEDVRAEVRERIRTVGYNGGLILAPAHVLGPEVPWENIVAFFEAADETE